MEPSQGRLTSRAPRSRRTAVLLSLLVLPGSGHWYLGFKRIGSYIAALASLAFLVPIARFAYAFRVAIETQAMMDPTTLPDFASAIHQAWSDEMLVILIGVAIALVCWIGAAIDLGLRKEPETTD